MSNMCAKFNENTLIGLIHIMCTGLFSYLPIVTLNFAYFQNQ